MATAAVSPVRPLCGRERRPEAVVEHREPGELYLERLCSEVEFVWAVVVVQPDDLVVSAGSTVVERVFDTLLEPLGRGDAQESYPTTVPSS